EVAPGVQRVAVVEAKHRLFRQRRLADRKKALLTGEVAKRNVYVPAILGGVLVMPDRLPVEKASAAHVESRQPDIESIRQQRSVREVFGEAPIDGPVVPGGDRPP